MTDHGLMRRWSGTIQGEPVSKANSRKVAKVKGEWRVIKSEKALRYAKDAATQLGFLRARPIIEGPVKVTMEIHYRSKRPDLDESLILDVLQGFVYKNDRQVVHKDIRRGEESKKAPYTYIEVEEVE